ncbi:MAG: hypothetical protein RJA07_117 [Bacteroidota bacterium]|jgi:hypothetical protein
MKVSGFTFIRNGIQYDYPFLESIQSILPICDEMVIAVGNCSDGTREAIMNIQSPKIKIIDTVWDDSLREGGKVLAVETNKAFDAISVDADWCFYIQGDEVFHQDDLPKIKQGMEKYLTDKNVEGLVFNHINFFASYDYMADSRSWVKNEVRVVRNNKNIRSWKDAMSFRIDGERKLKCKYIDATIYHYGWVKHPATQKLKREVFDKLWHDDDWIKNNYSSTDAEFDYQSVDSLAPFIGTHPAIMQPRIDKMNWKFTYDPTTKVKKLKLKYRLIAWLETIVGKPLGRFKNYDLI